MLTPLELLPAKFVGTHLSELFQNVDSFCNYEWVKHMIAPFRAGQEASTDSKMG